MNVNILIEMGENIKENEGKQTNSAGILYFFGENYEKWISLGVLFLENNYPNSSITERFVIASNHAQRNNEMQFNTMLGILKAVRDYPNY